MVRLADIAASEREHILATPLPVYETHPFVPSKPLNERRVALISTAGFHHLGEKSFTFGSEDYRIIVHGDPRPIVSGHVSSNFDRTGMQEDFNIAFPLDRLSELAQEGVIGSAAENHYSFMGAIAPEFLEKNARKLARLLKADGVDTVMVVPVCPLCTRTASGLAHYFEEEGIASVIIALVREHAEKIKPPRALWVPFELGRPLGAPGDAGFQRKVMMAAFALLDRASGPVLEDFPEEAPADVEEDEERVWACPVSFAKKQNTAEKTLSERVKDEIEEMSPWYEKAKGRRGRSMLGISAMELTEAVDFLEMFLKSELPTVRPPHEYLHQMFKFATEDLKIYYMEAAWAQPGSPKREEMNIWFWTQTEAGKFLIEVVEHAVKCGDRFTEGTAWGTILPATLRHLAKLPENFAPLTPEDKKKMKVLSQ